ncbi:MAG: CDP-diacylglycerol--glycerol-3-phosphate 3-phosphatidyltransferase [Candidatus Pelagibacterales bacterium]|jgi:cardiolipin synthase|tara:strand:+ start:12213 stop:12764 length:552 start_codon:yes stop_codon:yes gene_type:complete
MKNLPNILTSLRILLIPAILYCIILNTQFSNTVALVIFLSASASDYFDGYLARKYSFISSFGTMLDPIADKLLIIMVGIVLLYRGDINGINFIPLLLIISREVFISGLREYLAQLKTKIKLPVSNLGKYKTTTQMFALLFLISSPLINNAIISISEIGIALLWVASALSIISGYQYTIKFYKN